MPRTFKYTMSLYNLIGRWLYSVVIEAIPQLAEKLHVIVFMLQFQCLYTIFRQSFDKNECKYKHWISLSDVYRIVNYFGSLAKFRWSPSGSLALHATQCRVHESLREFTGPNLIKWLKCTWKFNIFLPDRMNFYQTCQAVRQSFVKTAQCSLHFTLVARKV